MPNEDIDYQLLEAARESKLDLLQQLVEAGGDVNASYREGITSLFWAVCNKDEDMVGYLIEKGAQVNYNEFSERTALMDAAGVGQLKIMQMLLDAGAEVDLVIPASGETALHKAVVANQKTAVKMLLDAGADPNSKAVDGGETAMFTGNARLWGETPLHLAAAYADADVVQMLLDAGADKTIANTHGELPLGYYSRHRYIASWTNRNPECFQPREISELLT